MTFVFYRISIETSKSRFSRKRAKQSFYTKLVPKISPSQNLMKVHFLESRYFAEWFCLHRRFHSRPLSISFSLIYVGTHNSISLKWHSSLSSLSLSFDQPSCPRHPRRLWTSPSTPISCNPFSSLSLGISFHKKCSSPLKLLPDTFLEISSQGDSPLSSFLLQTFSSR